MTTLIKKIEPFLWLNRSDYKSLVEKQKEVVMCRNSDIAIAAAIPTLCHHFLQHPILHL